MISTKTKALVQEKLVERFYSSSRFIGKFTMFNDFPEDLYLLAAQKPDSALALIWNLSYREKLPRKLINQLLKLDCNEVNVALAQARGCSKSILDKLADDPSLAAHVASNPSASKATLSKIYRQRRYSALRRLAYNPSTPRYVFLEMAKDSFLEEHLADSLATPPSVLRIIAKNLRYSSCLKIARNVYTPADVLEYLTTIPKFLKDVQLIQAVLSHPNCSTKLIQRLATDKTISPARGTRKLAKELLNAQKKKSL